MNYNLLEKKIKEKNLKQFVLAESIGMTSMGFIKMMKQKSMKVEVLEKIAEVLNIDVREFFAEEKYTVKENESNEIELLRAQLEAAHKEVELLKEIIQLLKEQRK